MLGWLWPQRLEEAGFYFDQSGQGALAFKATHRPTKTATKDKLRGPLLSRKMS